MLPASISVNSYDSPELVIQPAPGGMIAIDGVQGFLMPGDVSCLSEKVKAARTGGVIVEIGSFMGLSAIVMAKALLTSGNHSARIYCVDTWDYSPEQQHLEAIAGRDIYSTFQANVQKSGMGWLIHPIRKRSVDAAADFEPQSIEFLFIDGDHSYEGGYADLEAWYPKLRPGAVLIGHDCAPHMGVRRAVEEFAAQRGLAYRFIEPPTAHYMFEVEVPGATSGGAEGARQGEAATSPGDAAALRSEGWTAASEHCASEGADVKRDLRVAIIYDNTIRKDTTGEYCYRALAALCRETRHFLPGELASVPSGYDLYINIDDGLNYRLPPRLRPAAYWAIDTHLQYEWHLQKARDFDWVFAAQRDGAERLRRDGIASAVWLPLACDPEAHHPVLDVAKTHDVAFVGNAPPWAEQRAAYLSLIRHRFPNCFIGNAYFEDMARVYSQAKIVFNCSVGNDVNMRVFEAVACGSLLLTNDLAANGQNELFIPDEHLVVYHDAVEFVALAESYLRDDVARERIAHRGQLEAQRRHTYRHRMARLLDAVAAGQRQAVAIASGRRSSPSDDGAAAHRALAEELLRGGDLEAAARELGEAIRRRPDYAEAYNDLAVVRFGEGRYTEARDLLTKALELNPIDGVAQDNLSGVLDALSRARRVSIVILTHNELAYTRRCVESIRQFTDNPYELIFVDNASSDGTLAYLRGLDGAKVIANPTNIGFAAGCNQGMAEADGDYVLLLNNDVIVTEDWLKRLVYWAEADPAIGIVGPMSNYVAGVQRVLGVPYGDDMAHMHSYAGHFGDVNAGRGFPAYRVMGFCLLAKRALLDKIGGLDPRFRGGNYEDDDFCLRASIAGYKVWVAGDVFIHHFGSRTFIGSKMDYLGLLAENWRKFKDKWRLPEHLAMEDDYAADRLVAQPFEPARHFVPLDDAGLRPQAIATQRRRTTARR